MTQRIEEYSVGELARAAGVSVRTLHHYDDIGLLKPAHVATNGYRLYGAAEAARLQEILFYKSAGVPLADMPDMLAGGDRLSRLLLHREKVAADLSKQAAMLAALDRMIASIKGQKIMTLEELYRPFEAETQAAYEDWLCATYGPDMAKEIQDSRVRGYAVQPEKEAGVAQLREIETALVRAFEAGVTPKDVDLSDHQQWVSDMWGRSCDAASYAGLAELYLSHPDFIARFEILSHGFSQWLPAAMKAWAEP